MPDRAMKKLRWIIVAGALVNLTGTGLFVWTSTQARQANCANVEDAFDSYTSALAAISDASAETVAEFRSAYEPELRDCH